MLNFVHSIRKVGITVPKRVNCMYRGLIVSEARHYGIYWVLAATYFDKEILMQRLDELAIVESELLATLHPEPRIHS